MAGATRRCIRKAEREGVSIEEASPMGFAAEFHTQLIDVFSRQGLVPTYSQKRVQTLIDHVHPSGSLLLLRARAPTGESIAPGIFAGFGRSEERRVGKDCVSRCRSRGLPYHKKKKK